MNIVCYICKKCFCMKDRIHKLLTAEGIQPNKFAEIIGVQRSSISHILSGRNKPSFDVIQSILRKFPRLNSDWLILGSGEMYKKTIQTTLFDEVAKGYNADSNSENIMHDDALPKSEKVSKISKPSENRLNEKDIDRVIIFFKDKTLIEYIPE